MAKIVFALMIACASAESNPRGKIAGWRPCNKPCGWCLSNPTVSSSSSGLELPELDCNPNLPTAGGRPVYRRGSPRQLWPKSWTDNWNKAKQWATDKWNLYKCNQKCKDEACREQCKTAASRVLAVDENDKPEQKEMAEELKYLLGLSKTGPKNVKQAAKDLLDELQKDTAGQNDEKFKFPDVQKAQTTIHDKVKDMLEMTAQNHPTKPVKEAAKALLSKMDDAKGEMDEDRKLQLGGRSYRCRMMPWLDGCHKQPDIISTTTINIDCTNRGPGPSECNRICGAKRIGGYGRGFRRGPRIVVRYEKNYKC